MDADAAVNKDIAGRYQVRSYPTIRFFPRGEGEVKEGILYEGGRSEADFVKFLNEKCGTHRAVGGGLNELVRLTPCVTCYTLPRRMRCFAN